MGYPDKMKVHCGEFILDTESSKFGIGKKIIVYGRMDKIKAEPNYCITRKQFLAVSTRSKVPCARIPAISDLTLYLTVSVSDESKYWHLLTLSLNTNSGRKKGM